jgi:hypothetical protein
MPRGVGTTLTVLCILVLLGLVAGLVVRRGHLGPYVWGKARADETMRMTRIKAILLALEQYKEEHGELPASLGPALERQSLPRSFAAGVFYSRSGFEQLPDREWIVFTPSKLRGGQVIAGRVGEPAQYVGWGPGAGEMMDSEKR